VRNESTLAGHNSQQEGRSATTRSFSAGRHRSSRC